MNHSGCQNDCVAKFFVIKDDAYLLAIEKPMTSFKEAHFPKNVIYVYYGVSYCDQKEIMKERGVNVDHAILNRCLVDYSHSIAAQAKKCKVLLHRPDGWMKPIM